LSPVEAQKPLTLETWLEGRNKSAFARACGFKNTQQLFHYLRRKDGRPPVKRIGLKTARRIVRASEGAFTLEALLGEPQPAPPAQQEAA